MRTMPFVISTDTIKSGVNPTQFDFLGCTMYLGGKLPLFLLRNEDTLLACFWLTLVGHFLFFRRLEVSHRRESSAAPAQHDLTRPHFLSLPPLSNVLCASAWVHTDLHHRNPLATLVCIFVLRGNEERAGGSRRRRREVR